jgi:transcriptional regulator with XRE-family HTH domain
MTITQPIIASIIARLRDPKMPKLNQAQLADCMGYGRSWASKLMKGTIKNLSDEDTAKLQSFLGIRLMPEFIETGEVVPELAMELGRRMKDSEGLTKVIAALMELPQGSCVTGTRWIETKEMTRIGQEIIKIAFANEDKPGKVARLVLELLA